MIKGSKYKREEAMTESQSNIFENWCIVELFGHQKIAGKVTEQVIAGQGFVRVDVPQTSKRPAFTRLFGSGAIYSITPVEEEIAVLAAQQIYVEPVTVYVAPSHQLNKPDDDEDEDWGNE
jgi:hypothetical protein